MDSSRHLSVSTVMHLDSSLTRVISPTTLLSRFSFFSSYLYVCPTLFSPGLSQCILLRAHIDIFRRLYHSNTFWIWSDLPLFSYLPPILTHLLTCRVVLLLILIVLSILCANFSLFWPFSLLLVFCLWCLVLSIIC